MGQEGVQLSPCRKRGSSASPCLMLQALRGRWGALPPHHLIQQSHAMEHMLPGHDAQGGYKYLFLAQAVKQGFLLHPKANVDQGSMLPRAERSQAGWQAAMTLAGETKRNQTEASFSSPTQHGREQRRARSSTSHWAVGVRALENSYDTKRLFSPSLIAISALLTAKKQGANTHCHGNLKLIVYCHGSRTHESPTGRISTMTLFLRGLEGWAGLMD